MRICDCPSPCQFWVKNGRRLDGSQPRLLAHVRRQTLNRFQGCQVGEVRKPQFYLVKFRSLLGQKVATLSSHGDVKIWHLNDGMKKIHNR